MGSTETFCCIFKDYPEIPLIYIIRGAIAIYHLKLTLWTKSNTAFHFNKPRDLKKTHSFIYYHTLSSVSIIKFIF